MDRRASLLSGAPVSRRRGFSRSFSDILRRGVGEVECVDGIFDHPTAPADEPAIVDQEPQIRMVDQELAAALLEDTRCVARDLLPDPIVLRLGVALRGDLAQRGA